MIGLLFQIIEPSKILEKSLEISSFIAILTQNFRKFIQTSITFTYISLIKNFTVFSPEYGLFHHSFPKNCYFFFFRSATYSKSTPFPILR